MILLVCFEFAEEGVESLEKVVRRQGIGCCGSCWIILGMDVEDGGDGETKEEVVGCTSRKLRGREAGKSGDILTGEVDCVEPEDTAFVAGTWLEPGRIPVKVWREITRTLF